MIDRILSGLALALLCSTATAADFDGDGHADAVWRHADGRLLLQRTIDPTAAGLHELPYLVEPNWILAGTPDVDGDGRSDLLWLRTTGEISIWRVPGFAVAEQTILAQTFAPGWEFAGSGDVDGDGKDDLVWLNGDRRLEVWFMNGSTIRARTVLPPGPVVDANWHVVGVGDFDGDGHADVLWRSDQGQVSIWQLGSNAIVATTMLSQTVAPDARPAAIGDFDGDGDADILWPSGSGHVLWRMQGAQASPAPLGGEAVFASGFETNEPAVFGPPPGWTIAQTGDLDGDGTDDLIAADADGNVASWHMHQGWIDAITPLAAQPEMPYAGGNGWAPALARPTVTRPLATPSILAVAWDVQTISPGPYRLSIFDSQRALLSSMTTTDGSASIDLTNPALADARYFSVSAATAGIPRPPSPQAFRVEFQATSLGYWGALAIADIDGDGCIDLLGSRGDCNGGFSPMPESTLGLGALRALGRIYRDVRLADFDGDGINDLIANVYSPIELAGVDATYSRILYFRGLATGGFVEDSAFTARKYGGFGETIVIADFNNDGFLDVFLPNYTGNPTRQNYLLLNDGHGNFTEAADQAGVAMRGWSDDLRVEGAQAADINDDGWIDLYVGNHLFINQGVASGHLNFVDRRQAMGLPLRFDEGAKFIDWNNDGLLDFVTLAPVDVDKGPALFQFDGQRFTEVPDAFPPQFYNQSYGLNAADVDNDGRPDLLVAGGCGKDSVTSDCYVLGHIHDPPRFFLNRGTGFVQAFLYDDGLTPQQRLWNDLQTFADFDGNGALDIVTRFANTNPETAATTGNLVVLRAQASAPETMHLRVLGNQGQENQQGRVVRAWPLANPGFVMTGIVDGGSGYMANTPYTLSFAAPYAGAYGYSIRFNNGVVTGLIHPGQSLDVRRNGNVVDRATSVVDALHWLEQPIAMTKPESFRIVQGP